MNKDSSRSNLFIKMSCSKHHEQELTFSHNLSEIGADSAYEVDFKISVHQCSRCKAELSDLKWAINTLLEATNEQKIGALKIAEEAIKPKQI